MRQLRQASLLLLIILFSCNSQDQKYTGWQFVKQIPFEKASPISLTIFDNYIWVSQSDKDQVVQLELDGTIIQTIRGTYRPMHITSFQGNLFVPEYANNKISTLNNGKFTPWPIAVYLKNPSSIAISENSFAIANAGTHEILYFKDSENMSFGGQGIGEGEFMQPTDVHFHDNKIYVADSRNHRVQIFDDNGEYLETVGSGEYMNTTVGVFADENHIIATDYNNDQVLTFNHRGKLIHTLKDFINKPSDLYVYQGLLYVTNYHGNSLTVYEWRN
jgi:hypothetical protein